MNFPVVVVGTSHTFQMRSTEFKHYVERVAREHGVRAIAEELSKEGLAEKRAAQSMPMRVASALQIAHCFCDPDRVERSKLGMPQANDIRASKLPFDTCQSPKSKRD